jgi:thiamine-phosphate pyrophosphorylase
MFDEIDLYPVVSSEFTCGRSVTDVVRAVADGGARIVQIREKNHLLRDLVPLIEECRRITTEYGMLLIVNDRTDVAAACDADGVHLGQEDLPIAAARRAAPDLLLGCSAHSELEAVEAEMAGADYVNLGPIYPTLTKSHALSTEGIGLPILRSVPAKLSIPFTVMGGIKERHISDLVEAGAGKIAMVTEITLAKNIEERVRDLRNRIRSEIERCSGA